MEVAYAFLAKYAEYTPDGLLSMIGGGLETFTTPSLPYRGNFSIPVKISLSREEARQENRIRVEVVGGEIQPEGGAVQTPQAEFIMPPSPLEPTGDVFVNLVVNFFQIGFPRHGEYPVRILSNQQVLKTIVLRVQAPVP